MCVLTLLNLYKAFDIVKKEVFQKNKILMYIERIVFIVEIAASKKVNFECLEN